MWRRHATRYDATVNRVRSTISGRLRPARPSRSSPVSNTTSKAVRFRTIYNDGYAVTSEFDAAGNVRATIDKLGRRMTYRTPERDSCPP